MCRLGAQGWAALVCRSLLAGSLHFLSCPPQPHRLPRHPSPRRARRSPRSPAGPAGLQQRAERLARQAADLEEESKRAEAQACYLAKEAEQLGGKWEGVVAWWWLVGRHGTACRQCMRFAVGRCPTSRDACPVAVQSPPPHPLCSAGRPEAGSGGRAGAGGVPGGWVAWNGILKHLCSLRLLAAACRFHLGSRRAGSWAAAPALLASLHFDWSKG